MQRPRVFLQIMLLSGMIFLLEAHLVQTSLSIKGGESFISGDTVTIKWDIQINHNGPHRVYFSPASGEPWLLIDSVPETSGKKNMSYTWVVPRIATASARIRIFQTFGNISTPSEKTNDYNIVSKEFSIVEEITPVTSGPSDKTPQSVKYKVHNARYFDLGGRLMGTDVMQLVNERKILRRVYQCSK